jgi:hypothetical protein
MKTPRDIHGRTLSISLGQNRCADCGNPDTVDHLLDTDPPE